MRVELYLNPNEPGYVDFLEDLKEEFSALKGLKYKEETVPAPPKTLAVEHDILKFIFDHGDKAVNLSIALLQMIRAALERRNDRQPQKTESGAVPIAVLQVGDRQLKYPSSDQAERTFAERIKKGNVKVPKAGKGKSGQKRRKKKK
jgi:hypothetical protein